MARVAPFEDHVERYEDWFVKNEFAYQSELNAVKALLPACGKGVEVGVRHRFVCSASVCSFWCGSFHENVGSGRKKGDFGG